MGRSIVNVTPSAVIKHQNFVSIHSSRLLIVPFVKSVYELINHYVVTTVL